MDTVKKIIKRKPTRWWPAVIIVVGFAFTLGLIWFTGSEDKANQMIIILSAITLTSILLLAWVLFFSRLPWRTRLRNFGGLIGVIVLFFACFRISQISGNMMPLFEWRWTKHNLPTAIGNDATLNGNSLTRLSFSQFLGPSRNCKVPGSDLATDWTTQSPEKLWRQPIGPASVSYTHLPLPTNREV